MGEHLKQRRIINKALLKSYRGRPCILCSSPGEACHIKTVKSGGDDEDWNLLCMCRSHHRLQHDRGFIWLCEQYPEILKILNEKGWEFSYEFGEKRLARKY